MAVSLVKAIREYFAPPAVGLGEIKALNDQDRDDLVEMFAAVGIEPTRQVTAKPPNAA